MAKESPASRCSAFSRGLLERGRPRSGDCGYKTVLEPNEPARAGEGPLERQVWIFLDDDDEAELLRAIDRGQGVRCLRGRFLRGTADDIRLHPEDLATAD